MDRSTPTFPTHKPVITDAQLERLRVFVLATFTGMSMEQAFRHLVPNARPHALDDDEIRELVLHLVPVRAFANANPGEPLTPAGAPAIDVDALGDVVARIDATFNEAWDARH